MKVATCWPNLKLELYGAVSDTTDRRSFLKIFVKTKNYQNCHSLETGAMWSWFAIELIISRYCLFNQILEGDKTPSMVGWQVLTVAFYYQTELSKECHGSLPTEAKKRAHLEYLEPIKCQLLLKNFFFQEKSLFCYSSL